MAAELQTPEFPELEGMDLTQVPIEISSTDETILPLVLPLLPAGSQTSLSFTVTTTQHEDFTLRAWANPPLVVPDTSPGSNGSFHLSPEGADCFSAWLVLAADLIGVALPPGGGCALTLVSTFLSKAASVSTAVSDPGVLSLLQLEVGVAASASTIAKGCIGKEILRLAVGFSIALDIVRIAKECFGVFDDKSDVTLPIESVTSFDPNAKVGSVGAGEARYVPGSTPLPYVVLFENLPTASAPAQEVTVIDQLDVSVLDLETLTMGAVSVGGNVIESSGDAGEFRAEVDLRPENDLIVLIEGSLDSATGTVQWSFTSVDPLSGMPPADPLSGFLPPNVMPPEGEGSVAFSIRPKLELPEGTEIHNGARITFDANEPIDTPDWINTIDESAPVSAVEALDEIQANSEFDVQWFGNDPGSGVRGYTVFAAEGEGPFEIWLRGTSDTSGTFPGEDGRLYRFYSVAEDWAGNVEAAPVEPDATTRVVVDSDLDGVPDVEDSCDHSELAPTVAIGSCDSGVTNVLLEDGCAILDRVGHCGGTSERHGAFVACVSKFLNALVEEGVLRGEERGAIQSCAASNH